MKILMAYDGTLHAKTALRYGLGRLRDPQDEMLVLHAFDRSAFIDYDAGPWAEATARAEAGKHAREAKEIVETASADKRVRIITEEGDAKRLIVEHAESERFDLILITPRYQSLRRQIGRPVRVIPGTILVPVDNTDVPVGALEKIREEAVETKSNVLLLGIIPVHLYSRGEKTELETVRRETEERMAAFERELGAGGIETKKIMRSGYPDEEIIKAADDFSASLILIPAPDDHPSELVKAAHIIRDEPERVKSLLAILSAAGTA